MRPTSGNPGKCVGSMGKPMGGKLGVVVATHYLCQGCVLHLLPAQAESKHTKDLRNGEGND